LARLAARAANQSGIIGISIGASAEDLKQHNPNFISVASPWSEQWKVLHDKMDSKQCAPNRTIVVGDIRDSYSFNFRKIAERDGYFRVYDVSSQKIKDDFTNSIKGSNCIFLAMSMTTSQQLISKLLESNWHGSLFGTGDWKYYSAELRKLVMGPRNNQVTIFVPTGWDPEGDVRSAEFALRFKKILNHEIDPNVAYSYDAVTLGLNYLCKEFDPLHFSENKFRKLRLVRKYTGMSSGGNLLSPIKVISFER
jgi:hypothetical protein